MARGSGRTCTPGEGESVSCQRYPTEMQDIVLPCRVDVERIKEADDRVPHLMTIKRLSTNASTHFHASQHSRAQHRLQADKIRTGTCKGDKQRSIFADTTRTQARRALTALRGRREEADLDLLLA